MVDISLSLLYVCIYTYMHTRSHICMYKGLCNIYYIYIYIYIISLNLFVDKNWARKELEYNYFGLSTRSEFIALRNKYISR